MIDRQTVLDVNAAWYGRDWQIDRLCEECGELVEALMHLKRGKASKADVIGEMADVHVMMRQVAGLCGISMEDLDAEVDRKINRQMRRLAMEMRATKDERRKKHGRD